EGARHDRGERRDGAGRGVRGGDQSGRDPRARRRGGGAAAHVQARRGRGAARSRFRAAGLPAMSAVRELLARYLRQRHELGEDTLFLETLTRGEAIALASGRRPRLRAAAAGAAPAEETAAPPRSDTAPAASTPELERVRADRKSTRLNSSHVK